MAHYDFFFFFSSRGSLEHEMIAVSFAEQRKAELKGDITQVSCLLKLVVVLFLLASVDAGTSSLSKATLIFCGCVNLSPISLWGIASGGFRAQIKSLLKLVLSFFFSLHHNCSSLLQLAAVITAGLLLLYIPLCYEDFHFHVAHVYARLGYPNAQHILGQRYLQGNISEAVATLLPVYTQV